MSSPIEALETDVQQHGEAHAVIEEAGAGEFAGEEVEIRQGTTEFDYENEILRISGSDVLHRVPMDRVVRWYLPTEFTH